MLGILNFEFNKFFLKTVSLSLCVFHAVTKRPVPNTANKEATQYAETFMWSTLLLNPVQIANQIISLQLAVDLGLGREVSISTKEMVLFKTKLIESKAP